MNKDLIGAWKGFTQTALSILNDGIKTRMWKIQYYGRQHYKFHEDGGIETNVVMEPDIAGLVHESREKLSKTVQYNALCNEMDRDPKVARYIGRPVHTIQGGGTYSHWDYAIIPLLKELENTGKPFAFDEAIFDKCLSELDGYFDSETAPLLYIAPLYNFTSEIDEELKLQDDLKIRRTTEDELQQLMRMHSSYGPFPFFKVPRLKFSIEIRVDSPKVFGNQTPKLTPPDPLDNFDKLVTALRLFKSGNVAIDIIRNLPGIHVPGLHEGATLRESYLPTGRPYSLTKDKLTSFQEFWSEFKGVELSRSDSLSVALRRFNFGYGRGLLDDKLLDLAMAYEALFLKNEKGSNSYKLALRVARLLGNGFEERKRIFRQTREFYDKRSGTVHGGSPSLTEDMILGIEEQLRACFKLILKKLKSTAHSEILTHLDLD